MIKFLTARKSIIVSSILVLTALFAPPAHATIINIPADYGTIQEGIDASVNGDTVLVAEGTYYENIIYKGKKIVVTSNFLLDNDPSHIFNTIIDGSQPYDPDSASCVRIINGEDSTAVLQGFTITNGAGTLWLDEHGAGTYREGGGILTALTSPTIQYNNIVYNTAISGGVSSGGGGIRSGDGNPHILNNLILYNRGRYGAGIVLNYAEGDVRNNVIAYNTGGQDYGGSGIWKNRGSAALIENNTIVYNESILGGGGIYCWVSTMTLRNNIVWGNIAPNNPQIQGSGITSSHNDVEGGYTGTGDIDLNPEFVGDMFHLLPTSPCVDAGESGLFLKDIAKVSDPSLAQWPSQNTITTDIGAYGGLGAFSFEQIIMYADTTYGWVPLEVNLNVESIFEPDVIVVDLGDGDSAYTPAVNHIYTTNGMFDIVVNITENGQDHSYNKNGYIIALADTISIDTALAHPGESSYLPIYGNNTTPVTTIYIPMEYSSGLSFKIDSISTVGCRTEYFAVNNYINYDPFNSRFTIKLQSSLNGSLPELEPGSGLLAKLHFTINANASEGDFSSISLDGYNSYSCSYEGSVLDFQTGFRSGQIAVAPCCSGIRGNIDGDPEDVINIADIVYFVDWSFNFPPGPAPPCFSEADVNDDGELNIADIVYMVDYSFATPSGPPPLDCF